MCGGVNAVATAAVLPLGVLWILTRAGGRRRWALLGWWTLSTVLATLWWTIPLLVLGKYSPAFLDYIENAPITSRTTGLGDVIGGTSDWVAFASVTDWRAGNLLGTTPFLLLDAAALAALGLAGVCRLDNPHRRFLFAGVLAGLVIVSFGYTGAAHGWWADARQDALDGVLAPLRNAHKFDVVLRLPLVLGMAHFLSAFRARSTERVDGVLRLSALASAVVAVVGVATPAYLGRLAPPTAFEAVPDYWTEAAAYLDAHSDGGRALELPASSFGDYTWGSTHDDVLQPLVDTPWAVRNVIPLAQPGNIRFLDVVTDLVESGRPDDRLAPFLAANGVSTLVVRNDLDVLRTGAPDPVLLHQALDRSPGLVKVAEFGPGVGAGPAAVADDGARVFTSRGRSQTYSSVEMYQVEGSSGDPEVTAWSAPSVPVVFGDPSAGYRLADSDDATAPPTVLAGDAADNAFDSSPRVVTDGLPRREVAFAHVRDNQSATLGAGDPYTTTAVEPNYRLYDDQSPFETLADWLGVADVVASSSQSNADAIGTIDPTRLPAAAVDGDPQTHWQSTGFSGAVGQWWSSTSTSRVTCPRSR